MSNKLPNIEQSYHIEFVRKGIHLCSLSIPVLYYFMQRELALSIIIPLTLLFIIIELARYYYQPIRDLFYHHFGFLLRSHESDHQTKRLTGATYVLISATICILIFPKIVVVTCFSVLIICDITSALVGRQFGKRRFFSKTLEGSFAFFISGLIVIAITPKIEYHIGEYIIGAFAVLVGTIVEAISTKIDDNLSIPLSVGFTLWAGYHFIFPMFDIFKYS